ncbi:hypothetical protein RF55_16179, partial [Lasius niger]
MPEGRRIVDITCYENVENAKIIILLSIMALWIQIVSRKICLKAVALSTFLFYGMQFIEHLITMREELSANLKIGNSSILIAVEPIESETLDINKAAATGTVTVGIGYAQLEELCAAMNISCISEKTYIKHREDLIDDFEKTAMENMKMAGEIEKQLALEKNETMNGIPYITVVADGSWMKRSYGTAYDSLSGVGAIISYRTGKILFVGIRNKFCT